VILFPWRLLSLRILPKQTLLLLVGLNTLYAAETTSPMQFKDMTAASGIVFQHSDGSSGRHYIVENVASGLALFDYDGDGDIDIYFLCGAALPGARYKTPPRNALYRNEGHWRFTDVTQESGLGDPGHGLGVACGDYDNDGDSDVYVTNFGPNVMFRNNGDGSFTDVTLQAAVADGHKLSAGANFLDVDKDGDLDLFSASYCSFTYANHAHRTIGGHPVYVSPKAYEPTPDTLFRNNGDGSFTDISDASGISSAKGTGMGTVCADYDGDGDTDIYVGNDLRQNFLWENDGTGHFEEVGLLSGLGCDMNGKDMGTMGLGCGDYNNDGLLDFYATAYQDQRPSLYLNTGDGLFEDVSLMTGAGAGANHTVTWGNDFADFDNDGDRDLFVALGHLQDNIALWDQRSSYLAANKLYMNTGQGKFVDVSSTSGNGLQIKLSSRGVGFDDLDKDGDIDVVVLNSRQQPTLLRNDSRQAGHWLQVSLQGTKTNRDGVGAQVKVVAGDLSLLDEVHSGRGYQSHYGTRLHFGLHNRTTVDRVEVRWIGGRTDIYRNIAVDQFVLLRENESFAAPGWRPAQ
jgi:enediyne biosynthesis protein E4